MKLVRHCVQCLLAAAPVEPALRYHDELGRQKSSEA